MPITTEKSTRKPKRGVAHAVAGGALLFVSLPLVLAMLPDGISLGHYTVSADFISETTAPLGVWQSDDYRDYTWIQVFNWGSGAYVFTIWPSF